MCRMPLNEHAQWVSVTLRSKLEQSTWAVEGECCGNDGNVGTHKLELGTLV